MTTADHDPTHAYVVLLRTVSAGRTAVRPAPLKAAITGIEGVHSAKTIRTDGNVVVAASLSGVELRSAVEEALREAFGYEDPVVVIPREHVAELVAAFPSSNPTNPADNGTTHSYITIANDPLVLDEAEAAATKAEAPAGGAAEEASFTRLAPGALAWTARVGAPDFPMAALLATPRYRESTVTRSVRVLARLLDIL